ncbi:F-type H+-transporting ATPase subunit delta [Lebetimonas natsushimae]|uniref:F-type H+-transporting ATPase subunit delta n=1 Tax=Lebetimonas natsushimae TaxID=1936991 RepID=A0A292YA71_9BACT|nr:F0F1 ATP synthase subunit delta [Lebetimonas natsushimae]GAX87812.1 F-type H+-transporting ATPase subunit delta [Lebetimonas natsushimae]
MVIEKYTKALISSLNKDEQKEIFEALKKLALLSKNQKFILILKSPLLSQEEKINFVKELTNCSNQKFVNFIHILLENKRIDLLKDIFKNYYAKLAFLNNTFEGVVEGEISEDTLKALEEKLSSKFNAIIKLNLEKKDINGIKVFVDVLNVEVAIDENRIKQDIITDILKAI